MHRLKLAAAVLAAALVAACASPGNIGDAGAVITPNPHLKADGMPPLPARIAQQTAPYSDFRAVSFVEWHPTLPEMLVAHRRPGETLTQIHRLRQAGGALEPLTRSTEPVTLASYEPTAGRYLVFARARGGDEAAQLFRLDPTTGQETQLTDPQLAHAHQGWRRQTGQIVVTSVPLDRNTAGGQRPTLTTRLSLIDPLKPEAPRALTELPASGWFGGLVSEDGQQLAITRYLSANESQIWLIDLNSGQRRQLLPAAGDNTRASHFASGWTKDGSALHFVSDRASEFRELMALNLASGALTRLSGHIPWDASPGGATPDGRTLALKVNADGQETLRLLDASSGRELPAPAVPPGRLGGLAFHRAQPWLAFTLSNARSPGDVQVLDVRTGRLVRWAQASAPPGVDLSALPDQDIVRWKSFDGLQISGLMTRPPAKFTGKRPVVVLIHGGPEGQATAGFNGRWNYFSQELGIAVIEPNVRGSLGYGKTFLRLDNGRLREDSVKDIGALLDWIASQPGLDANRVLLAGGSYGGYMALAGSVHYADRIRGAMSAVGISNFVTFLERTESYRRDLRRVEYGDERDPAMRAFLESISPLNQAQRIKQPLYVVQGLNDPRVPWTESEQIVQRVRANGVPVWYLLADNEGHGFARKENADYYFHGLVKFVEERLLDQP